MKRFYYLFWSLCILHELFLPRLHARGEGEYVLNNEFASYYFSVTDSLIRFEQIESPGNGHYIFNGALWKITLYNPSQNTWLYLDNLTNLSQCDAWTIQTPHQDFERLGGAVLPYDKTLFLSWSTLLTPTITEPLLIDIQVRISLAQGADASPRAAWQMWIENRIDEQELRWVLYDVSFPQVSFKPPATSGNDYLALCTAVGKLVRNPISSLISPLRGGYGTAGTSFSMQVNAYYQEADNQGLYFAVLDADAQPKEFEFMTNTTDRSLNYRAIAYTSNMKSPTSSYQGKWQYGNDYHPNDVYHILGPFEGNWYDAASIYRHWATQQTWARFGKLNERTDPTQEPANLPEFLREGEIITLYFSPQVEEFEFQPELLSSYLADYASYFGLTDIIFQIWHWWWNKDIFLDMTNNPWSPSQALWSYYMNMPEYTGGGDFIGDNEPLKMRRGFTELAEELHSIPNVNVSVTVSPIGMYGPPFDHFSYDWTPNLIKTFFGYSLGFLCFRNHPVQDVYASMIGDMEAYTDGQIDGVYVGYGYFNYPCYNMQHTHYTEERMLGGGSMYNEDTERFSYRLRQENLGNDYLILSEGLVENSCSAADLFFIYHVEGSQKNRGAIAKTYNGNDLFVIPFFPAVYHDYMLLNGMIYPYSGVYFHNEYFNGSYVTPTREPYCENTTFDYFPLDSATNTYPSYDATIASQFNMGARINIADMDQAAGPDGLPLPGQRFLERGAANPDDPLSKSRRFLLRLFESQRFYGIDPDQPARRFMILGQLMRPLTIAYSGMTPFPKETLISFDDFFYSYCVMMNNFWGGDPTTSYIWFMQELNILSSAWRLEEQNATLLVLTNWTAYDQTVDVSFDPQEYGIADDQTCFVTEIGAGGWNPSAVWEFPANPGTVTLSNISVPQKQVKMFQLYPGTPPILRNIYVSQHGNDLSGKGTELAPFRTIHKALAACTEVDSQRTAIHVEKGVYEGGFTIPDGVIVSGTGDRTIIEWDSAQSCVRLSAQKYTCGIEHLVIHTKGDGAAIQVERDRALIRDVIIDGGDEGIMLMSGNSCHVVDCVIRNCNGDGIVVRAGSPIIEDTHITGCSGLGVNLEGAGADTQLIGLQSHRNRKGAFAPITRDLSVQDSYVFKAPENKGQSAILFK